MQQVTRLTNQQLPPQCPHCGFTLFNPNHPKCEQCGAPIFVEQNRFTDKTIDEKEQAALTQEHIDIAALRRDIRIGINPTGNQNQQGSNREENQTTDKRGQGQFSQFMTDLASAAVLLLLNLIGTALLFLFLTWLVWFILCSGHQGF